MNLFTKTESQYTDYVNSHVPKKFKKSNLFLFLLLAITLPVTIFLTQQIQDTRQRAQVASTPPEPPSITPVQPMAAKFTGVRSEKGRIEFNTSGFELKAPLTVETWVKPDPTPSNETYSVISTIHNTQQSPCEGGFNMYLDNNPSSGVRPRLTILDGGHVITPIVQKYMDVTVPYGDWIHLAFTVNENNVVNYYVNGKLHDTRSLTSGGLCDPGKGISVGGPVYPSGPDEASLFRGLIDEVQISKYVKYRFEFTPVPYVKPGELVKVFTQNFDNGNIPNGTKFGDVQFVPSKVISNITPSPTLSLSPTPRISVTPTSAVRRANVSGTVFIDTNRNGRMDTNETPYNNAALRLLRISANGTAVIQASTITNTNGLYTFANISNIYSYRVMLVTPAGYTYTTTQTYEIPNGFQGHYYNGFGITPASPSVTPTVVKPSLTITQKPSPSISQKPTSVPSNTKATLTGTVYFDNNNNGKKDFNESGYRGAQIRIYRSNNGGSVMNTNTDLKGNYSISNLDSNVNYIVYMMPPAGYSFLSKNPLTITTSSSKSNVVDFRIRTSSNR